MIDSEEKARAKAKEIWEKDELFIVLSESRYKDGVSYPRAYKVDDKTIYLNIFTDYDLARIYCNKADSIVQGQCLIGRMTRDDEYNSLKNIINIAIQLGIFYMDIDCVIEDRMSIPIPIFMEFLGLKPEGVNVLLTQEEHDKYQAEGGKFPVKFNAMELYSKA